jgi:molybdate-binding protein
LARQGPDARLVWLPASSRGALQAAARGETHMAGTHLQDRDGNVSNVGDAGKALKEMGGLVVAFASWEQGLVVQRDNPLGLRTVADLVEKRARLINREPGAGCRELLETLLAQEGIDPTRVSGFDWTAPGHLAVARTVASGGADVGIALRAAAQVLGLGFVPLTSVRFDLAVPRDLLNIRPVNRVIEALQSKVLRREIGSIAGYDVSQMGRVVAEVAPAA